jgi:hypothetical protein
VLNCVSVLAGGEFQGEADQVGGHEADRVKQQQGLSRDPYDRDGDTRQVGGGGSDTRQVRGGAVFSPSAFGGHLLAGDCILALLFSLLLIDDFVNTAGLLLVLASDLRFLQHSFEFIFCGGD